MTIYVFLLFRAVLAKSDWYSCTTYNPENAIVNNFIEVKLFEGQFKRCILVSKRAWKEKSFSSVEIMT